jgi:hypothetical protein
MRTAAREKIIATHLPRGLTVPCDGTTLAFVPVLPPAARQIMFHARIVSPRGSLYLAAEATPYDLENLRTHVHDLRVAKSTDTRLELRIDRPSTNAAYQRVSTFLQQLEAEGIQTSFSLSPLAPSGRRRGAVSKTPSVDPKTLPVGPKIRGVGRRGSA